MKNVAKCDTWCELQNPVNHRVFERKLRPKPSGRGHACLGVTNRRPHPLEDMGRKLVSVCYRTRLAKIRAKGARSVSTCGGEFKPRNIAGRSALDDPKSSTRPQVRRDHPLSLSISISGGKETNKDSLSNGERTGRAQLENRTSSALNCSLRSVLSDGPGPSSLERGAREGESPSCGPCRTTQALSTSRVVWECSPNRAVNSVKAKYGRDRWRTSTAR
ncbi:LOW QUALITY PROTEIN: hypothetical protein Bca4012_103130 [Brassica carinata]